MLRISRSIVNLTTPHNQRRKVLMSTTNVTIHLDHIPDIEDSVALNQLCDSLRQSDIFADPQIGAPPVGVKDGGLTLGLTLAGLALSSVSTLVSALSFWASKRAYSITFQTGEISFSGNNLNAKEALAIAEAIRNNAVASDIKVLVSRR